MDKDNITHEQETGYARRPHRKEKDNSSNLKIRNILNIIFMLLAIVGVAIYLLKQTFWGTIIILVAMAVKMVECVMRMIK